jgi:hypothetical protein
LHKTGWPAAFIRRVRAPLPALYALTVAFVCAASAAAQGAGKKKDQGAFVLLLLPLLVPIVASLQMAVMGVFPAFARRCAAAVTRYRWQTPLIGLVALLAFGLLAAMANALAGGNQRAGLPVVFAAILVATVGGVGLSLPAGRWALKRIGSDAASHPIVEILAGSSVLGWGMFLVPCVGQLAGIAASLASMGAFFFALVGGRGLDEASARTRAAPAVPSPPAPEAATTVQAETEAPGDSQMF